MKIDYIFHPTTGGGLQLCKQYNLQLLGKILSNKLIYFILNYFLTFNQTYTIPLEPKVLLSAEKGKCIYETAPDSIAAQTYTQIVNSLLETLNEQPKS